MISTQNDLDVEFEFINICQLLPNSITVSITLFTYLKETLAKDHIMGKYNGEVTYSEYKMKGA